MSTHVPGFQSFFRFFASFFIGQIHHQQPKGLLKPILHGFHGFIDPISKDLSILLARSLSNLISRCFSMCVCFGIRSCT